jgi:hypothetical protein
MSWWNAGNGKSNLPVNQETVRVSKQLQEQELMLQQLDNLFVVLENYMKAVASGKKNEMEYQNIAITSQLNLFGSSVLEAKNETENNNSNNSTLKILLGKTRENKNKLNNRTDAKWKNDTNVQRTKNDVLGYLVGILKGTCDVHAIPAMAGSLNGDMVTGEMSNVLGSIHGVQESVKQMQNPKNRQRIEDNQNRLRELGTLNNENETSATNSGVSISGLTRHYQSGYHERVDTSKFKYITDESLRNTNCDENGFPDLQNPQINTRNDCEMTNANANTNAMNRDDNMPNPGTLIKCVDGNGRRGVLKFVKFFDNGRKVKAQNENGQFFNLNVQQVIDWNYSK